MRKTFRRWSCKRPTSSESERANEAWHVLLCSLKQNVLTKDTRHGVHRGTKDQAERHQHPADITDQDLSRSTINPMRPSDIDRSRRADQNLQHEESDDEIEQDGLFDVGTGPESRYVFTYQDEIHLTNGSI